jgi:hypothetical protein
VVGKRKTLLELEDILNIDALLRATKRVKAGYMRVKTQCAHAVAVRRRYQSRRAVWM